MATLYDSYTSADDQGRSLNTASGYWQAMTFTASTSYVATQISMKVYRVGSPGTKNVKLYSTSGGNPYGILATGSFNGNSITTDTAGEWIDISITPSINIVKDTVYAIVTYGDSDSADNETYWRVDIGNGYSGGSYHWTSDSGASWTNVAADDLLFKVSGEQTPVDKIYTRRLVAIGNSEVWYESSAGTMEELTAANGVLNTTMPLEVAEAYQKLFIVNGINKKVLDYVNSKLATTDAGANPCTSGMTLTGGTSAATMIVDYVDGVTDNSAANVYGKRNSTTTFVSGETVTGTNSAGNAVSFVTSAAEVASPHWYNWTVFGNDTTTYGTMLTEPTLICLYRGRLVIAGDSVFPHAWQMTKVGFPYKVLYDFNTDADLSAVTYSNTKVGLIGDIITTLIPYKDDLLIFGCANSMWILIGDPLAEGQIAEITHSTGIWGSRAWCIDDNRNLYFLGNDGIYQMPVGETSTPPTNISKSKLPQLITTLDLDKSLHRVVLSYDPVEYGIIISKTLLSDGTNTNYFYSLLTGGFFPESYPTSCGIFSSCYYPATDETYKKFLVGCTDGYIREFDPATKNDTTTSSTDAISSYCTLVQQIGQDESLNGLLKEIRGIVAGGASGGDFSDSDGLSVDLHKGTDAETVLEDIKDGATAFTTITWSSTGKQNISRPRMKGSWAGLKLYNSTASQTWALEKLFGDVVPKGKV